MSTDFCNKNQNVNSPDQPMVTPPPELVGLWKGNICTGGKQVGASKIMIGQTGNNTWEIGPNGRYPTNPDEVETIVGWQCVGHGTGYWWGMVKGDPQKWCNAFQLQQTSPETYVYYNLANSGLNRNGDITPLNNCPTSFTGLFSEDIIEATVYIEKSKLMNSTLWQCVKPSSEGQQSCNSLFNSSNIANPWAGGIRLPILDPVTCLRTSDGDASRPSLGLLGVVILIFKFLNVIQ